MILDKIYWKNLSALKTIDVNNLDKMILKSIGLKNSVVLEDLKEENKRKILNFGHTLGHAIESNYLGTKKELLHGEAIAIGMILETFLSHKILGLSFNYLDNITKTITRFFKKIKINNPEVLKILSLLKHDKKVIKGKINFVLINQIGVAKIDVLVNDKLIKESFDFYNSLS